MLGRNSGAGTLVVLKSCLRARLMVPEDLMLKGSMMVVVYLYQCRKSG